MLLITPPALLTLFSLYLMIFYFKSSCFHAHDLYFFCLLFFFLRTLLFILLSLFFWLRFLYLYFVPRSFLSLTSPPSSVFYNLFSLVSFLSSFPQYIFSLLLFISFSNSMQRNLELSTLYQLLYCLSQQSAPGCCPKNSLQWWKQSYSHWLPSEELKMTASQTHSLELSGLLLVIYDTDESKLSKLLLVIYGETSVFSQIL